MGLKYRKMFIILRKPKIPTKPEKPKCNHDAIETVTQYDILKGFTVVTHRCLDCHKVLQKDIHKTRG